MMFFCLKAQSIQNNAWNLYIKQPECGTMKPIISVKYMNMPADKWKVHLPPLVLSEMSASAVPQFNAELNIEMAYIMLTFSSTQRRLWLC